MTSHLEDYLNYYKNTKSPGYAVLVAGEWGVGKTFQVKRYLKPEERYYVSLFGLQSVAEVHSAVLAEVDPTLAKVKQFLGGAEEKAATAGHWLGALGGWAASAAGAMLRKEAAIERTLVFDDLERSNLELEDKLGIINAYVDQHAARVVVLAHDAKIAGSFAEMKEKLIGQTIRVEPRLEEAFEAFCGEFVQGREGLVVTHGPRVLEAFRNSGAQSLRVLRHVVEDNTHRQEAADRVRELVEQGMSRPQACKIVLPTVHPYAAGDHRPITLSRLYRWCDGPMGDRYTKHKADHHLTPDQQYEFRSYLAVGHKPKEAYKLARNAVTA